ncbi:MAG: YihY/virulence factor BrkB family protein [Gemmatimonadales bacterium]|nr:YihY/virulence factor BrkB family protein [Gemmatimonadales bacterium]
MLQAADDSHLPFLASAITFDALLAAVPFVLLLLVGLTFLAQYVVGAQSVDPVVLFHRFLPAHATRSGTDPFAVIESVLARISQQRTTLSLYAAPAFLWFSTRLFGGIRTSLNSIFDVALRPPRQRNLVVAFLFSKARDAAMVLATVVLFLANTFLTTELAIVQARGTEYLPRFTFLLTGAGRVAGELLTVLFSVSLFFVIYKYASVRKLRWRTALLAATFAAVAFEIAKRLYALYLGHFASLKGAGGDATIGAIVLFVIWLHYTAIVFLLGAVVAETWELRRMQKRQRAILT